MTQSRLLTVVHVDDEPDVLESTRRLLNTRLGIEYVAGITSAAEALQMLNKAPVDLLLLDVEMPQHNGLWLAERLRNPAINIAFLTSHTGYAAQAFEVCALDYLLKPLDEKRLHILLERIRHGRQHNTTRLQEQIQALRTYMDPQQRPVNMFLSMLNKVLVIKLKEVLYFAATNTYTTVAMSNGERHLTSRTIKTYEEALSNHPSFQRVSRNNIVNKNQVTSLRRDADTRRYMLTMANGDEVETIFKTKEEVIQQMQI